MGGMERVQEHARSHREKPSVKQVYALAAALCVRMGEEFPASRSAASELIQRLWEENGDPRARLSASGFERGKEAGPDSPC
jgi:hypothetical protein